jgi:carbamoyl-phosphate synthase small subunit
VNQPVRTLATRHVEITVQNHGVVVDRQAAEANKGVEITHDQINDHTVEGIRSRNHPAFSVQYSLPVVELADVHPHLLEFLRM